LVLSAARLTGSASLSCLIVIVACDTLTANTSLHFRSGIKKEPTLSGELFDFKSCTKSNA